MLAPCLRALTTMRRWNSVCFTGWPSAAGSERAGLGAGRPGAEARRGDADAFCGRNIAPPIPTATASPGSAPGPPLSASERAPCSATGMRPAP